MEIKIIVPFPPTVNSYYTRTRNGVFISRNGKLFRKEVLDAIKMQLPGVTLDNPLHVEVTLYPPDRRTRDLDNYMKGLLDAITHAGTWEDDALIDQLEIHRGETFKGGLCLVEINHAGPKKPKPAWVSTSAQ